MNNNSNRLSEFTVATIRFLAERSNEARKDAKKFGAMGFKSLESYYDGTATGFRISAWYMGRMMKNEMICTPKNRKP